MKPFPGEVRKDYTIKCHPYVLTDDQEEWLSETFPMTETNWQGVTDLARPKRDCKPYANGRRSGTNG